MSKSDVSALRPELPWRRAYLYDTRFASDSESLVTQLMAMYAGTPDEKLAAASFLGYISRILEGGTVRGPALPKTLEGRIFAGRVPPMLPRRGRFRLCDRAGHLLYFSHLLHSPNRQGLPEEVRFVVVRPEPRASEPGAKLALERHDNISRQLAPSARPRAVR